MAVIGCGLAGRAVERRRRTCTRVPWMTVAVPGREGSSFVSRASPARAAVWKPQLLDEREFLTYEAKRQAEVKPGDFTQASRVCCR